MAICFVLGYEPHQDGIDFALDLTPAYADANLGAFIRTFRWSVDSESCRASLRLTDAFKVAALPGAIEECFASVVPATVEAGKATWHGNACAITMEFDPLPTRKALAEAR